jgi:hypothetical protein
MLPVQQFSQHTIFEWFLQHQVRLRVGDNLPSIEKIAQRAGLHRDTIYSLLSGARISVRSQYALSRVILEVEEDTRYSCKTRLLRLRFNGRHVGLQTQVLLQLQGSSQAN